MRRDRLLLTLGITLFTVRSMAQSPGLTLAVDVPLVSVDAVVRDSSGEVMTSLKQGDFTVYENGVEQHIQNFETFDVPYNILLLFDRSSSTQDQWRSMRNAAGRFISNLRRQDLVAVGSFDDGVVMFSSWQDSHTAADRALDTILKRGAGGGTNLYWSLERATQREFRNVQGRRALVVLTDGRDNMLMKQIYARGHPLDFQTDPTFQHTREVLLWNRVPVYFIAMNTDRNRGSEGMDYELLKERFNSNTAKTFLTEARVRMEVLASTSGGRVFFPKSTTDIVKIYDQISRDLSASYTLSYVSSQALIRGENRKIEVRSHEGFSVRQSRDSYTVP